MSADDLQAKYEARLERKKKLANKVKKKTNWTTPTTIRRKRRKRTFGKVIMSRAPVARIDPKTNTVMEIHHDMFSAAIAMGRKSTEYSNISRCCQDQQKTAYGWRWEYVMYE